MDAITITNVIVFTVDQKDTVIPNGTVIIQNGFIKYAGPAEESHADVSNGFVVDGKGRLAIIPGLINVHSQSSLLRGFTENMSLLDSLPAYDQEFQVMTQDDAYEAAMICYLEAVKGGTTCIVDMNRFMDSCAHAAQKIGLRVNLVPYLVTEPGKNYFETIASSAKVVNMHHLSVNGRLRVSIGPEHLLNCLPETYQWVADFAREHQIGIHTNSSAQKEEVQAVIKKFGKRPIALLKERGVLGPKTVVAQCVWLDDDEIQMLADTGTSVAHCPVSNAKLACGIAPIQKMLRKGITVGLGSDAPISNNSLDMFEQMKFASLIQKASLLDPAVLPAAQMLRMATIDSARLLGIDHEIGSIEVGKKADLVLIDFWKPHLQPIVANDKDNCVLWNLVFAANGADVHSVIIDGDFVIDDGKFIHVTVNDALKAAAMQTEDFLSRWSKKR